MKTPAVACSSRGIGASVITIEAAHWNAAANAGVGHDVDGDCRRVNILVGKGAKAGSWAAASCMAIGASHCAYHTTASHESYRTRGICSKLHPMKTLKHALGQRLVKCGKALLDQRQDAIPEPARADGKSPTLASNTLDVDRGSAGLSGSTSIASSSTVGPVEASAPKHTKPSANEPIKTVTISAPQVDTDAIIHPTCQSTQDQSATNVLSKITGYIRTVKGHTAQIESAAIFLDKITGKKSPFGTGEAAVMVKDFLKRFFEGSSWSGTVYCMR
ncbi:hypothetical protein BCR44DRAFT_1025476 [Catenaria anguillulae PL171]|uniref:Uncharacterized protein n=1 Tax=Catenaria anguillulae PL171 TaxID=765915 RepID=A0A1Y2HT51_9FUNG|nr:hypothetical protein BCR44DRAFT_1025476 [Catenaria anguillulae PL171]